MQKEQQQLAALIKGKKVAFIGAGVSHKALIKEFVELGAHVTLCDQKKSVDDFGDYAATIRELGIGLSLGENYLDGFKGQDIIMRTPGFVGYFEKPLQDAMAAGTMVTSEVELFFEFCPCEIVAVTGSDGKTTTTTLMLPSSMRPRAARCTWAATSARALLPMLPEVGSGGRGGGGAVQLPAHQHAQEPQRSRWSPTLPPTIWTTTRTCRSTSTPSGTSCIHQVPPCRAVLGYENEITRGDAGRLQGQAGLVHPPARDRQWCFPAG